MLGLVDILISCVVFTGMGAAFGAFTAVLCLPVLMSGRIRSLFRAVVGNLWPLLYALFLILTGAVQGVVIGGGSFYILNHNLMVKVILAGAIGVPAIAWFVAGGVMSGAADNGESAGIGLWYRLFLVSIWHAGLWCLPIYLFYLASSTP